MGERFEIAGLEAIRFGEVRVRLFGASLLQQIQREVLQDFGMRASEPQCAAEVPFAGRQVVQFRQQRSEVGMGLRVQRIHAQRCAGNLFRLFSAVRIEEQGDEVVERPVGRRLGRDRGLQRLRRLVHLPTLLVNEVSEFQGVRIEGCGTKPLLRCRGGRREISALQGFAALHDQRSDGRMSRVIHAFTRCCEGRTSDMVHASGRI